MVQTFNEACNGNGSVGGEEYLDAVTLENMGKTGHTPGVIMTPGPLLEAGYSHPFNKSPSRVLNSTSSRFVVIFLFGDVLGCRY